MNMLPASIPILRPPGPAPQNESWAAHLRARLRSPWAPGEWNDETKVWTPSPENPDNCIAICARRDCVVRNLHNGLCQNCKQDQRNNGWTDEQARRNPRPPRWRRRPGQRCLVVDGENQCGMDRDAIGLCFAHRGMFDRASQDSVDIWIGETRPRPFAFVCCTVPYCGRSGDLPNGKTPLCEKHTSEWHRARRDGRWEINSWLRSASSPEMPAYSIFFGNMDDTLSAELMVVIQDHVLFKSGRLHPGFLGTVARKAQRESISSLVDAPDSFWVGVMPSIRTTIMDTLSPWHRSWRRYDPWSEDLLFLQDLGLRKEGPRRTKTPAPPPLDLTAITQDWLREPYRRWVLLARDRRRICMQVFGLLVHISRFLDEHDPAFRHERDRLDAGVMSMIVHAMHARWPRNPTLGHQLGWWWQIVDFARRHELWDNVPRSFARDPGLHRNRALESEKSRPILTRRQSSTFATTSMQ